MGIRTSSPAMILTVPRKAMAATPHGSSRPSDITIPTTSSAPPFRCQSVRVLGVHASLRMLARRVCRRTR